MTLLPFVTVGNGGNYAPSEFQQAINTGQNVEVLGTIGTTYNLSTGLIVGTLAGGSGQKITIPPGVFLSFPQGFSGTMVEMNDSVNYCNRNIIEGGVWIEAGTPQNKWTGMQMHSSTTKGCTWNQFRDMEVIGGKYPFRLLADTIAGSYCNDNWFTRCIAANCTGNNFDMTVTSPAITTSALADNRFDMCDAEMGADGASSIGFNLDGARTILSMCKAPDASGSQKQWVTKTTAVDTMIYGKSSFTLTNDNGIRTIQA